VGSIHLEANGLSVASRAGLGVFQGRRTKSARFTAQQALSNTQWTIGPFGYLQFSVVNEWLFRKG
jgi:hypothetical protein